MLDGNDTKPFADTETSTTDLESLLSRVSTRSSRVSAPATCLAVDVDGESYGQAEAGELPCSYMLPSDARSMTIRDQAGTIRAHVLLQDQQNEELQFDGGRLTLLVANRGDDALVLTLKTSM